MSKTAAGITLSHESQPNRSSEPQSARNAVDMARLAAELQSSMRALRGRTPSASIVAMNDGPQGQAKGLGGPIRIGRPFLRIDDSIKKSGSAEDERRDNADIARDDYDVAVTKSKGRRFLEFPNQKVKYPLTESTEQVGIYRVDPRSLQVNVVDKMKNGVISIDRISVMPGTHRKLKNMTWRVEGGKPEKTLEQLEKIGVEFEPEYSRITVRRGGGGLKYKHLAMDGSTGELHISHNAKGGILMLTLINLEGEASRTLRPRPGQRTAQRVTIDIRKQNSISSIEEFMVDRNGDRIKNDGPAIDPPMQKPPQKREQPLNAPRVKPHSFHLNVTDDKITAAIFNHGFSAAQEFAKSRGYVLGYKPSGTREKSLLPAAPADVSKLPRRNELNRIELQEVWAQQLIDGKPAGKAVMLGNVRIQDKTHLFGPIASPEKIASDIHRLMKAKLDISTRGN